MRNTISTTIYTVSLFALITSASAENIDQVRADATNSLQTTHAIVHQDLVHNTRDLVESGMLYAEVAVRLERDAATALQSTRAVVMADLVYNTSNLTRVGLDRATDNANITLANVEQSPDFNLAPADLFAEVIAD